MLAKRLMRSASASACLRFLPGFDRRSWRHRCYSRESTYSRTHRTGDPRDRGNDASVGQPLGRYSVGMMLSVAAEGWRSPPGSVKVKLRGHRRLPIGITRNVASIRFRHRYSTEQRNYGSDHDVPRKISGVACIGQASGNKRDCSAEERH